MKIDVQVPENMEELISQALLESLIGDKLKEAVGKVTAEIVDNAYSSPVRKAIESIAHDVIKRMLETEESKAAIEQAVMDAFQSDKFKEFLAEKVIRKLQDY